MTSGQRITREDLVEQSVNAYVKTAVFDRLGYPSADVEMLESWPYDGIEEMVKTYLAAGVHFDDGGHQAELGSPLKVRYYTVEFYVIGKSLAWARNLANQVKSAVEHDGYVPLLDFRQAGSPQIDAMQVDDDPGPSATRQYVPHPEPWQRFIYMVHGRVIDFYDASLT